MSTPYRVKDELVDEIRQHIKQSDWDYVDWIEAMAYVINDMEAELWDKYLLEDGPDTWCINEDGYDEVPW